MLDNAICSAVREHAWVGMVRRAPSGVLEVRPANDALAFGGASWALTGEYLSNWADLYEWAFKSAELDATGSDFIGLTTATTPLPDKDVRDWIEHTVALVQESKPRRVVDLGCGTGLLLRHLHDVIESYVGIDPTKFAVDRIREARLPGVRAILGGAHDLFSHKVKRAIAETMGEGGRPDCVVLNNVVQCFPGTKYLASVLRDAIELVESGGRVILGDLRNLALAGEYRRWLETGADSEPGLFRDEEELFVDPNLIGLLAASVDRPVKVSIRAKTMPGDNEFTRFRYDVVIHVDPGQEPPHPAEVSWRELTGDRLATLSELAGEGPLAITGIPNARTASADGVSSGALSAAIEGTGLVATLSLDDPALLEVRPAGGVEPRLDAEPLEDDSLERFVARRLPELLRSHLAESFPGVRLPEIVVRKASGS
ncbi:hypothetical protein CFP71_40950 [Amycolatopsis thailandensis]|uniref:Methyltransferase domain-containing protein n=1 Tax=Amycolatopsis thailandensis TaxID=589330 RepID=A0A229RBU9_9PSEU|nr:methyltransferase domain-containing protein [Amycolatopsis thailandensis]OXM44096.1 hypothetical protein CFP71_40950 [Amycolatopsis thailandensis]